MTSVGALLSLLAVLTSVGCTALLFRAHAASGLRMLLWSALCFVFLSINNLFLFLDLIVFPEFDLRPYRLGATLLGVLFLLFGFVWEDE